MTEHVEHRIYFQLSTNISINVLYEIVDEFDRPAEMVVDANGIGFILRLDKGLAKYLLNYGRYIDTICDFDQEQGGSYI